MYSIHWTEQAKLMLKEIGDGRIQEGIVKRVEILGVDPEKQGKPLVGELIGLRSVQTMGQRYRIIYRVEHRKICIVIVAVGIRKERDRHDVYTLAQKLVRLHLVQ
jgi:mRNA interferase RelE/StbE